MVELGAGCAVLPCIAAAGKWPGKRKAVATDLKKVLPLAQKSVDLNTPEILKNSEVKIMEYTWGDK